MRDGGGPAEAADGAGAVAGAADGVTLLAAATAWYGAR